MDKYAYEVNGATYIQKPLVLGQVKQLLTLFGELSFTGGNLTVPVLVASLGERLPTALAVIVTKEGESLKEKDIDALAAELTEQVDLELAFKMVEDFFDCNPVATLSTRAGILMESLKGKIKGSVGGSIPQS